MSDVFLKGGTVKYPPEIYGLVSERFAPLAHFLGPLYAGSYSNQGSLESCTLES